MILSTLPILLSIASLSLSIFTLWRTTWHRGTLRMTRPTLLFMGREGPVPKVFMRTLLFATAVRGLAVEALFLKLRTDFGEYQLDGWSHGDAKQLVHGSGVFVGQSGVAMGHHFFLVDPAAPFLFAGGAYRIEVFACVFGRADVIKIYDAEFAISDVQAVELNQMVGAAAFLRWDPIHQTFSSRVERAPVRTGGAG